VTVSTIEYDKMNRPVKKTNALGNSYEFEYSDKGDCTKRTDAKSQITNYTYDADHRLIGIDYPNDSDVTIECDQVGNRTKISDGVDDITFQYNLNGQLTKLTNSAASSASIEYEYNDVGLRSWMRDYEGEYCYYGYDDLLRLTSIAYPTGGTVTFDYATSSSLRTKIDLPNGAYTDYQYDLKGQVTSAASRKSDETLLESYSHEYDPVGRLVGIEDEDANETSLGYDAAGNLTDASFPGELSVNYYYDAAGHRTSATDEEEATTTFEYDEAGQLTECGPEALDHTTFEYDLNGNLIEKDDGSVLTEYDWSDENGLIGVAVDESTVWQSTYYPDGKRFCRTNTDGSIYYLYDGGKAIATYDTDWDTRETFGYGLGSRDPIVNTQFYDGQEDYYYVKDGFGNVDIVLDANEATAATIGLTACGVPDPAGDYDSDIQFGAGSMRWDADVQAYVTSHVAPDPANPIPLNLFLGDCGQCATEVGLTSWDDGLRDPLTDPGPVPMPPRPWPLFTSPFKSLGYPVMLDAGDAGLAKKDEYGASLHHYNGIDWVSMVGKYAQAIADCEFLDGFPMEDQEQPSWPLFRLTATYAYDPYYDQHQIMPLWRDRFGPNWVSLVQYGHHILEDLGHILPRKLVYSQEDPVAKTFRGKADHNLGPHLHLGMTGEKPAGDIQDTNWMERYFEPMPEIPMAAYLMAVCRYGWTEGTFGHYTWDWASALGFNSQPLCMAYASYIYPNPDDPERPITRDFTLGICAQACHSAVASAMHQDCPSAIAGEGFWTEYSSYGVGEACTRRCDDAFSDFLLGYWHSFEGTTWMELTYDNQTSAGPVHSGYLYETGSWVYDGGIASKPNFDNPIEWVDFQTVLLWAWGKADEMMDDAERPAYDWYKKAMGGNASGWAEARTKCRGKTDHQFLKDPVE